MVPVSAVDALAWAAGTLTDLDILTRSPLVPEAVFIVMLPDRKSYRQVLSQVKFWMAAGAVFLIARTGTPVVDRHMMEKNGGIRGLREPGDPVKWRIVVPPPQFAAWVKRWSSDLSPILKSLTTGQPGAIPTAK